MGKANRAEDNDIIYDLLVKAIKSRLESESVKSTDITAAMTFLEEHNFDFTLADDDARADLEAKIRQATDDMSVEDVLKLVNE